MNFVSFISRKINSGSDRSIVVKKNILGSLIIKGIGILTSLLLVPVTLNLLDEEKYGVWITLYSVVTWFNMMDIGLGNGFRNKFAEAIALGNHLQAQKYVETIYGSTTIISLVFFLLYSLIHPFLNWNSLLNVTEPFDENISLIVWMVFGIFSLQLILKNISTILLALQKTALSNSLLLIGNIVTLLSIWILGKTGHSNLLSISFCFMVAPIVTYLVATIVIFSKRIIPVTRIRLKIHKDHFQNMMSLGLKFFFIQITTIVLFSSGNFVIAQLFSPKEVTPYNITYRLYAATMSVFTILIAPFWSAYTEAITVKDFNWIKTVLRNLNKMWLFFAGGICILFFVSPLVFYYWIGQKVTIPIVLSGSFAVYALLLSWTGMFAQFLNGVGKIKIQLYISFFQCITNIPLAIVLAKYFELGITGVILATNINLLIAAIILPIQVNLITKQVATGIWNK